MDEMELRHIKDREVDQLSGGELQRYVAWMDLTILVLCRV